MPICCSCNSSGRCRNCSCVKAGRTCSTCLPSRLDRCSNTSSNTNTSPNTNTNTSAQDLPSAIATLQPPLPLPTDRHSPTTATAPENVHTSHNPEPCIRHLYKPHKLRKIPLEQPPSPSLKTRIMPTLRPLMMTPLATSQPYASCLRSLRCPAQTSHGATT